MVVPKKLVAILALVFAAQMLDAQQKRALTPEDVADIRAVFDANISPDGTRIAFVVTEPGDPTKPQTPRDQNIWMVPVDGREPARPFESSPRRDNSPRWSSDGQWLAFLSNRGEDNQNQVWLVRADGGTAERLTSAKTGVQSFKWSPDGRMIAYLTRDDLTEDAKRKQERRDDAILVGRDDRYMRLWDIRLEDRTATLVTRSNIEVRDFDWSADAQSFAVSSNPVPGPIESQFQLAIVRRSDGERLRTLADNVYALGGSNVRWSPDGTLLLFFEGAPSGTAYWMSLVNPAGGQARPLLKDYAGTFWAAKWAPDARHVIAEAIVGTRTKLLRIDVGTGEVSTLADLLNSGADFSASADGRTLAFIGEKADSPREVWSLSASQPPRQLTTFNPHIASLRLGSVREVSWSNRKDGQVLHGVLVTPADFKSGQSYPTIVEAHPGNAGWLSGWQGSWYQWAQLLASNGYVVFLPNVRGVTSQGWAFSQFIHTYAGPAFDDTMDGVDALIAQGTADPTRLGIGGWSNGGYMTTWAITHTDRFKAAVAFAAPVDFPVWWGTAEIGRFFLGVMFGGTPVHARRQYEASSPLYSVQNCRTPTLMLHGETDATVPAGQTHEFYAALKTLGVETEMVVYPREGHSIGERAHQIDFQRRVLAWFDKYLK